MKKIDQIKLKEVRLLVNLFNFQKITQNDSTNNYGHLLHFELRRGDLVPLSKKG